MSTMTWTIVDHLCRSCGGRVLKSATGAGMTPGGNPIWKCADCGASKSSTGPDGVCWCGFSHRNNHSSTAYVCQPFSVLEQHPDLLAAFLACGCDPKRGEVGIMLERDYRKVVNG